MIAAGARITEFARRWDCPTCGGDGWALDAEGRPVAKCPDCTPAARDADADAKVSLIRRLIATRANDPGDFTATEAVGASLAAGNELGGVVQQLERSGVIVRVGSAPSKRDSRRGGSVAVWRGAAYAETPPAEPQQLAIKVGRVEGGS